MNFVTIFTYVMSLFTGISRSNPEVMGIWKEYLVYCIRSLSSKLSYAERLKYVMDASVMGDGDLSHNFMAFGIEVISNLLGDNDPALEYKLYSRSKDVGILVGDVIKLVKGETEDKLFYVDDRTINGYFKVDQYGKDVVIYVPKASVLLKQQDERKKMFILQLATRAQAMTKSGTKLTQEQIIANGTVGTINFINMLIAKGSKMYYKVQYGKLGDYIAYTDDNGMVKCLTTVYYPWAGNNLLSSMLKGKALSIDYIESYSTSQGNETIVICGRFR